MKIFKLFFILLIFALLVGCGQIAEEVIAEEEKQEEEEVLIEKVSEEEGIRFILSVLEGGENISVTPVFMIEDEFFFAIKVLDHMNEMTVRGETYEKDEDVIRRAIERIKTLLGTSKYFDHLGIIVTEEEVDERIQEFINSREDINSLDDFYQYAIEAEGKSRARTREDFAYMIRRDKMLEKFFDQYAEEVTETELVALYQEKLEEVKGTGFKLAEYGEYRKYLLEEIVKKKIFEGTSDHLGEITDSLEIIYFKE